MHLTRCLIAALSSTLVSCSLYVPSSQNVLEVAINGYQSFHTSALDFTFFEDAHKIGDKAQENAREAFQRAADEFKDVGDRVLQIKRDVESLVTAAADFKALIGSHLEPSFVSDKEDLFKRGLNLNIDLDAFSDELSDVLDTVQYELRKQFPPPSEAVGHDERVKMVDEALAKMREAFSHLIVKYDIPEDRAMDIIDRFSEVLRRILVTTGDLAEQHPDLMETIIISSVLLIIPESWFIRPVLGLFGFGPSGPIKGTPASWAQRRFFGGIIKSGSWFSRLQSISMKPNVGWVRRIVASLIGLWVAVRKVFGA
jgi:hypothetical protein